MSERSFFSLSHPYTTFGMASSPISAKYELKYPQEISPDLIFFIYEHNGALMFRDMEAFLRKSRFKSRHVLSPLSRGVSTSSMERIRLADVLKLFSEDNDVTIVSMFWEAARFYSTFSFPSQDRSFNQQGHYYRPRKYDASGRVDPEEWRLNLALFYTTICRWKNYLDNPYWF